MLDLLIRNCRLPGVYTPMNVGVFQGRIFFLSAGGADAPDARSTMNAEGSLLLPGFVIPHMHWRQMLVPDSYGLHPVALGGPAAAKPIGTKKELWSLLLPRLRQMLSQGVAHLRCHVGPEPASTLEALLELRDKLKERIHLELVVLSEEAPSTASEVEDVLKLGADVLGRIVPQQGEAEEKLRATFQLARKYGTPVYFGMHFGSQITSVLERIADLAIQYDMQGQVSVSCPAVFSIRREEEARAAERAAEAGIHVILLPERDQDNIGSQKSHELSAMKLLKLLMEQGVNAVLGTSTDPVHTHAVLPFNPDAGVMHWGPLQTKAAWMNEDDDIRLLIEMATVRAASILQLKDYGIRTGAWADLVLFPVSSERDFARGLWRERREKPLVWRRGTLVDKQDKDSPLFGDPFHFDDIDT